MPLELEFTVEPFDAGAPGPHVKAAEDAAATAGELMVGPFGTLVEGSDEAVISAISEVVRAALNNGGLRVTLQVSVKEQGGGEAS